MNSRRKTVVITQSNYIPWRGYFDMIRMADELILLDCVQFTRRDWRNRNQIKTPNGTQWLTIPVETKGLYSQAVDETRIAATDWAQSHIRALELNYRRAAGFESTSPWLFEALRRAGGFPLLSESNQYLLGEICIRLGISTPIIRCTDIVDRSELLHIEPTQRLLNLCRAAGATHYLSGPAARAYMDTSLFAEHGVAIAWMDYEGYPQYGQCWGPFEPRVSIADLLLNCGDQARNFLLR
jgi:hypothetical protein